MTLQPTKCKLGAKECLVLKGTRALEICLDCRMVERGTSLMDGTVLKTPLHYVTSPKAHIISIGRGR